MDRGGGTLPSSLPCISLSIIKERKVKEEEGIG
jgi:hypothetical protein